MVVEDLEDAQGGAQGEAEDGQDAEGAGDLLVVLGLDEPGVVGCLGEDFGEAVGEAVLGLVGEEEFVGWAVGGQVLAPVGAAEGGDLGFQRGDAGAEFGAVEDAGEGLGEFVDVVALDGAEQQGVEVDGAVVHGAEVVEVAVAAVRTVAEEGRAVPEYEGAPVGGYPYRVFHLGRHELRCQREVGGGGAGGQGPQPLVGGGGEPVAPAQGRGVRCLGGEEGDGVGAGDGERRLGGFGDGDARQEGLRCQRPVQGVGARRVAVADGPQGFQQRGPSTSKCRTARAAPGWRAVAVRSSSMPCRCSGPWVRFSKRCQRQGRSGVP